MDDSTDVADRPARGRWPLRCLMVVSTVATITIGFAAFGIYLDRVQRTNLLDDVDAELVRADRASAVPPLGAGEAGQPPEQPSDPSPADPASDDDVDPPVQVVLGPDGAIVSSSAPFPGGGDALAELARRTGSFSIDDPPARVLVSSGPDGTTRITALSLDSLDETMREFRRTLLAGGLVILVLEGLVVWALAAALVRPVTRMAGSATAIADGALDTPIDPPSGSRETAELARALDRMVERLRSTIDDREAAAAAATAARDDMRRFLADFSHELRTPLTALKGYSDLHAGGMLTEPGALDRAMDRIGSESDRLARLATDMLALARETPVDERSQRFDPVAVVEAVVGDLRAAFPGVPVEVSVDPAIAAAPRSRTVSGFPDRLHQAVLNLGSNACRLTDAGTSVRFDVSRRDDRIVVEVADHGPGVDPEDVDRIFLPFYRPEASRGRAGAGGAGLGLAITDRIVTEHDGTVSVTATPGDGAVFTVSLPVATDGVSAP